MAEHVCPACGIVHDAPEMVATLDETETVDTAEVADAAIEIARIEAERDIELAKIGLKRDHLWQEERVATLEAQLDALRNPVEPAVVVVEVPDPEPADETVEEVVEEPEEIVEAPEPVEGSGSRPPRKKDAWWG